MGVRQWTVDAIKNGGTLRWAAGILIKGIAEIAIALALGWLLTQLVVLLFPIGAIRDVLGPNTENGVWLFLFLGIAKMYTICTFTST